MKRSSSNWLPDLRALAAEQQRREAARMRAYLTQLQDPAWPAWPTDVDADHHRWVRAHWSSEECDRFDAAQIAAGDLFYADLRLTSHLAVYRGLEPSAVRQLLAQSAWPVWPEAERVDWETWVKDHWDAWWSRVFARDLAGARRDLAYREDYRQEVLASAEDAVERLCRQAEGQLSEAEMAKLLTRRVCGIRGRYCLTYSTRERALGISEADIDAP